MINRPSSPAIILAAFGTTVLRGMKTFEQIDGAARGRFAGHVVRWAFTSGLVSRRLSGQGVVTRRVEEVLAELATAGYGQVAIQPLHVAPGHEFARLGQIACGGLEIAVGRPLLDSDEDVRRVAAAIAREVRPEATNVLVLHGTNDCPACDRWNLALARAIEASHVFAASLEGLPGLQPLQRARRHAARTGRVHFIPAMLAAGGHIAHDVLGDRPDSWKNLLAARDPSCAPPLGHNRAVLDVYFDHLEEAMGRLSGPSPAR
jgi:sirohydrochlorin cobaltochelatase